MLPVDWASVGVLGPFSEAVQAERVDATTAGTGNLKGSMEKN